MNTTTQVSIPVAAIRWLNVNIHFIDLFHPKSPVMKALKAEYRHNFGRDLKKDLQRYLGKGENL